ncbi:MAG: toprim domain-containing protein [Pararhodobacter sp.]
MLFSGSMRNIETLHLGDHGNEVWLMGNERMTIYGGDGGEHLIRWTSNEGTGFGILHGGAGDDHLVLLTGGELHGVVGNNTLVVNAYSDNHVINGGTGDDVILLSRMRGAIDGGEGFNSIALDVKAGLKGGDKLMLGGTQGGAVRLTDGPGRLVVGEGTESTLSLLCGLLDGPATAWAALSTSGLRGLRLPVQPGRLTIAVDGDKPGREAGHALAERAHALGWQVGILDPGEGADFNDILTGKAVAA